MNSKINIGQIKDGPNPLRIVCALLEQDINVEFNLAIICDQDEEGEPYGGFTDNIEFHPISIKVNSTDTELEISAVCKDSRFIKHTDPKEIFILVYNTETKTGQMKRAS